MCVQTFSERIEGACAAGGEGVCDGVELGFRPVLVEHVDRVAQRAGEALVFDLGLLTDLAGAVTDVVPGAALRVPSEGGAQLQPHVRVLGVAHHGLDRVEDCQLVVVPLLNLGVGDLAAERADWRA